MNVVDLCPVDGSLTGRQKTASLRCVVALRRCVFSSRPLRRIGQQINTSGCSKPTPFAWTDGSENCFQTSATIWSN